MRIKSAFQHQIVILPLARIVPIKTMAPGYRKTDTYRRIAASIQNVGIIEPLVVFPTSKGSYLLLDGHTRLDILAGSNSPVAKCLLATDNETYTYNKRVNYVPPIAQHRMILRALAHVSEERIASALNVSVDAIRKKRDLLNGICPEAAEILGNQRVSAAAFAVLRKMKPIRQIEVARLMVSAHKFSGSFARALLDGTNQEFLIAPPKKPRIALAQQAILEQETDELLRSVNSIQANYGNDVLNLTSACRYVERLLANSRVHRYLAKHHADILATLEQLLSDITADRKRKAPKRETSVKTKTKAVAS